MKIRYVAALLAVAVLASACAEPSRPAKMALMADPRFEEVAGSPYAGEIRIGRVDGGEETSPMWTSEVDAPSFKFALDLSLTAAGLSAGDRPGRYELNATLVELEQPLIGFDMTVSSRVAYDLVDRESRLSVQEEVVTATYTASAGSSLLGVRRLQLANEGSMRENIRLLIGRLLDKGPSPEPAKDDAAPKVSLRPGAPEEGAPLPPDA